MASTVSMYSLEELSKGTQKQSVILETELNTQLHIKRMGDETVIMLPFGNNFDIIDGDIIIKPKK